MYLVYTQDGATDEWIYWRHNYGWASLENATPYGGRPNWLTTGELLDIGEQGELAPFASLILDMEVIMSRHKDANLASEAGRLALASKLARGLQRAKSDASSQEVIYEKGYELRTYQGV